MSLLQSRCVLLVRHAEFDALIAANRSEFVLDRLETSVVSRLPNQVLQSLCLRSPALVWRDTWQECATQRPTLRLRLELDFYSMRANLPIKRIQDLLKV